MEFYDFVEYFEKIEKFHPNMFTRISKEKFNEELEKIKENWENFDEYDQYYEMFRLNALLADLHTNPIIPVRPYPFVADKFKEGYFITNVNENHLNKDIIYSKIIAINGIPINQVAEMIEPIITKESKEAFDSHMAQYLNSFTYLRMCGVTKDEEISLTLLKDKKKTTIKIRPNNQKEKIKLAIPTPQYAYIDNSNKDYLYLKINRFRIGKKDNFNKDIWYKLLDSSSNQKNYIIDLRNNGGGNFGLCKPILKLVEAEHLKGFCLINHNSFSSSVLLAQALKNAGFILVGEPAGQPPVFYGGVVSDLETKAGLRYRFPTKYYDETTTPQKMMRI